MSLVPIFRLDLLWRALKPAVQLLAHLPATKSKKKKVNNHLNKQKKTFELLVSVVILGSEIVTVAQTSKKFLIKINMLKK